jgi:hypothetical protein
VTEFCLAGAGYVSQIDKYLRRTKTVKGYGSDQIVKKDAEYRSRTAEGINVGINNNEGPVNRPVSLEKLA